ncbi:MAG TPA: Nif3-like dinuclear metal center hexameric protein [Candidatus Deferrimicrobiaceae bacterium]|nr:Nif3-like dinuclear metal center hexameric protein [Candidatus Deferrimicrobiaceae bacterium]
MTSEGRVRLRPGITVRDVWSALDDRYPFAHRADWDNVGILAGDPAAPVRSILIALDATPGAIGSCRKLRADLLLTHHPVIFSPLKSVRPDQGDSVAAYSLLRMGVAVISAHTNADAAPRGVSWAVARRIGLREIRPLVPGEPSDACKVTVFVPPDRVEEVLAALSGAGGGRIGAYSRCSYRVAGWGTFLPGESATPFAGIPGREERVEELRLEAVVARSLLSGVLRAVRAVHPYEEPAIDVYPLAGGALGGGIGAVGEREAAAPLGVVLEEIRRRIRPAWIRVAGPSRKTVRRIAVVAGSGSEFAGAAREAGADLFVTGDLKYHQALEAAAGDMPVADVGHGSAEKWILPEFRRVLAARFGARLAIRIFTEQEPQRAFRPGATRGGTAS